MRSCKTSPERQRGALRNPSLALGAGRKVFLLPLSAVGLLLAAALSARRHRGSHSAIAFRPAAVIAAQTTTVRSWPPSRVMPSCNLTSPSSTRSLSWS